MPAHIVVGLGYGDEGKGAVTDCLTRLHPGPRGVVRFNGGAQAAHNVVLPDGSHHTFSQFGSGVLAGAQTYLSKHVLINPSYLFIEWEKLNALGINPQHYIAVQADATITTPFHVALNRVREKARGQNSHGTCGMGIGETVLDQKNGYEIKVRDLNDQQLTHEKLLYAQKRLREQAYKLLAQSDNPPQWLTGWPWEALTSYQTIRDTMEVYRIFAKVVPTFEDFDFSDKRVHWIFEGAQGVLLDEYYGFHPHTTWSKTTNSNALELLDGYEGEVRTIGVTRSYITRHGAGPLVTEDPELHERFPEAHNSSEGWQGSWRVGWTDWAALRYATDACMVDELAVTHLDRVEGSWKICLDYQGTPLKTPKTSDRKLWEKQRGETLAKLDRAQPRYIKWDRLTADSMVAAIEDEFKIPVTIRGTGPTFSDFSVRTPTPQTCPSL